MVASRNYNLNDFKLFDSHLHIINKKFPLIANNGYTPDLFLCADYLQRMKSYQLIGGAVVSGSFQGFDQTYLIDALKTLGSDFVGITQIPESISDDAIFKLNDAGVRGVRFNLRRGGSESIHHLSSIANRVYDLVKWHVELYIDSVDLPDLYSTLIQLPSVSIDHLGLSKPEFKTLAKLVENGTYVKATGFSRVTFDVKTALRNLHSINPTCLMFGSDLPSTRAPLIYNDNDFLLVIDALGEAAAKLVFSDNALNFYRLNKV